MTCAMVHCLGRIHAILAGRNAQDSWPGAETIMPSFFRDLLTPGPLREFTLDLDVIEARERARLKADQAVRPPEKSSPKGASARDEKTALLDADQVAELLKVSRRWVMARTRAGEIPALRFGKVFRYKKSAIEEWVEACHAERLRLSR